MSGNFSMSKKEEINAQAEQFLIMDAPYAWCSITEKNERTDRHNRVANNMFLENNKTNGRFMIIAVFMTNYRGILCILSILEIGCNVTQHSPIPEWNEIISHRATTERQQRNRTTTTTKTTMMTRMATAKYHLPKSGCRLWNV